MDVKFDPTFYSTVAQVLPVLLAVVFVDLLINRERDGLLNLRSGGTYVLSALVLALGAEFLCLRTLKEARPPGNWEDAVVISGLAWPGLLLVIVVLRPITEAIGETRIGTALLRVYFVGVVVGFVLFSMDVVSLSELIVVASVAPAGAVVVQAISDGVPARVRTRVRKSRTRSHPASDVPARHGQGVRWLGVLFAVLLLVAASKEEDEKPT